jgi:hypothetical protein
MHLKTPCTRTGNLTPRANETTTEAPRTCPMTWNPRMRTDHLEAPCTRNLKALRMRTGNLEAPCT